MMVREAIASVHEMSRRAYNLAAAIYHELFHNEMNEKEYDRHLLDGFAARLPRPALVCDAGCGPSAHIGRYLFDKGIEVVGVDISDKCIELATALNPGMRFVRGDIARLGFDNGFFDGVVSYYSIIHTPKKLVHRLFHEFNRILKPSGRLLIAVKAGSDEGYQSELIGIKTEIYFSLFSPGEIETYLDRAGFEIDSIEKRNPYGFEIQNERIFALARKGRGKWSGK